jgi:hypothetical protein
MTATASRQTAASPIAPFSLSRLLRFIGAVLFIVAAFAAGGHVLFGIPEWTWGFAAFGAWVLSTITA